MQTPQARVSPSWLRITVTGGSAPMGTGSVGTRPTIVAAVAPMAAWGATTDVVIAPWLRNERAPSAGLKTISYADNVIAYRYAHRHHADEAVFANTQGQLCEGTGTNVAVAYDGRMVTPTLAAGCLPGVHARTAARVDTRLRRARRADRSSRISARGDAHLDKSRRAPHPARGHDRAGAARQAP